MDPRATLRSIFKNPGASEFLIFKGLSLPHLGFPLSFAVLVDAREGNEGMGVMGLNQSCEKKAKIF